MGDTYPDLEVGEGGGEGQLPPKNEPTNDVPVFELDGKQVPFNQLDPNVVREWYETHRNIDKFRASTTQKAQEIARQREELEDLRRSYERQIQEYEAIVQYLNTHPDLAQYINQYVESQQGRQEGQLINQGGNNMNPYSYNPYSDEVMKRIEALENQINEKFTTYDQEKQREEAYKALKEMFEDFDPKSFEEYFEKDVPDFDHLKDVYTILEKARRFDQIKAQQEKQQSNVEPSNEPIKNIEPNTVVPSGSEGYDQLFEQFAKSAGVEEY